MRELVRSNNPVLLSWLMAALAESGIEAVILDGHTSILEGSAGAIPRRLMVIDEDYPAAHEILEQAEARGAQPDRSARARKGRRWRGATRSKYRFFSSLP